MAVSRVWIGDGCTACGLCEAACPEVLIVGDIAEVRENVDFDRYDEEIIQSAVICPVDVIHCE